MFTSFSLPFSFKIKAKLPNIFRYFTQAHTMAFPKNSFLFFGSEMSLLFYLWLLLSPFSSISCLLLLTSSFSSPSLFWLFPPHSEVKVKVAQSCPTLCDPTDYRVLGILQARILEWVAFPCSRGSSQPRDQIQVSCLVGGFFISWATREAPLHC